jgi:integrase
LAIYRPGGKLLDRIDTENLRGKRDYALLAVLVGCGLRRNELVELLVEDFGQRDEHWLLADLVGKGGHTRTVPIPNWVKSAVDGWTRAAEIKDGFVFRAVDRAGQVRGSRISSRAIWGVVRKRAAASGLENIAPHDLRRTCARLCHDAGGELDQIQFLLGHVSIQTTERYIGCKQKLRNAVNDRIGLETLTR